MKPILFNTEMVRAILDGRKTVTRRVVSLKHLRVLNGPYARGHPEIPAKALIEKLCDPPYRPGDILYVRETFAEIESGYLYKAGFLNEGPDYGIRWRPSIHMPKEAARLFLRVTDVRVERLQDMTIYGLISEGFLGDGYISQYAALSEDHFNGFKALWDSTIEKADMDKYGWKANPWVRVIEFEWISKEEALENEP